MDVFVVFWFVWDKFLELNLIGVIGLFVGVCCGGEELDFVD